MLPGIKNRRYINRLLALYRISTGKAIEYWLVIYCEGVRKGDDGLWWTHFLDTFLGKIGGTLCIMSESELELNWCQIIRWWMDTLVIIHSLNKILW